MKFMKWSTEASPARGEPVSRRDSAHRLSSGETRLTPQGCGRAKTGSTAGGGEAVMVWNPCAKGWAAAELAVDRMAFNRTMPTAEIKPNIPLACEVKMNRAPQPANVCLAKSMMRTVRPMGLWALALAGACALGGVLPGVQGTAQAYLEPSIVPTSWDLNFTSDKPRAIAVEDISGETRWYWYITYKVTNHTGEERLFVPEVQIATDQGDLIRAGQNVPSSVFFAIKEKLGNKLLESPNQVVGKLLQGEDFARESVVIWPAFKHDIDQLSVFVTGLSGESGMVKNPLTHEDVIVRKTRMLTYRFPGDDLSTPPRQQAVLDVDSEWIMR